MRITEAQEEAAGVVGVKVARGLTQDPLCWRVVRGHCSRR